MLLETTVAMYTLLIGILTFCAMAVFANKVQMQASIRSNAYQIAKQQLDTLQTTSFENLLPTTSDVEFEIPADVIASLPGGTNSKYEVSGLYKIENRSTTTRTVSVRIRWRNASTPEGQTAPWSTVRLATVVVKPGSVTNELAL